MISTDLAKTNNYPVTSLDDFSFEQVSSDQLVASVVAGVRGIYFDSFPPFERVDYTTMMSDVVVGKRQLTIVTFGGKVIAFAMTLPIPNTEFTLLEYLAVQASMRNRGIGSRLLKWVIELSRTRTDKLQTQGIILEVEEYGANSSEEERGIQERRMQFYFRHGAKRISCADNYRIPNLETDVGTIPMTLLVIPFSNNIIQRLSGDVLKACICGIYLYSYGRGVTDATLRKTLEDLSC